MSVADVSSATWDELVGRSATPVVVDVWAPWCIPCKKVEPIIADAAATYGDRLTCLRLDADDSPELVARFQVLGLPTVLLFVDGGEVGRITGVPRGAKLTELIEMIIPPE